jgi:hypothetical protein
LVSGNRYSRILTQNWDLSLTYNFAHQDNNGFLFEFDDNGSSTSNAVFLTVSRNFTLLGGAVASDSPPGAVESDSRRGVVGFNSYPRLTQFERMGGTAFPSQNLRTGVR